MSTTLIRLVLVCVTAVGMGLLIAGLSESNQGSETVAFVPPPSAQALATAPPAATVAPTQPPAATVAPTQPPAPKASPRPLIQATQVATAVPATPAAAASAFVPYTAYTVQPGDSLRRIAGIYGVTVPELIEVNSIPNPDSLTIGEVLRIPRRP